MQASRFYYWLMPASRGRNLSLFLLPKAPTGLTRPTYPSGCNFIGCARCRPVVRRHINRKTLDHIILYGFVFSDPTLSHR